MSVYYGRGQIILSPAITKMLEKIFLSHNIHNLSLQLFSQDYDLASHITYVVC